MCNLSQVATGARYLRSVDQVLPKSNMCSIWGATETTGQQRADQANSNERGGGQNTSNSWRFCAYEEQEEDEEDSRADID